MKRMLVPILLSCALWLACPLSGRTGAGDQVSSLLSDPQAGLASLDDYRATLKITFKGSQDGQSVDSTDSYLQTVWRTQAAVFTTIDAMDDSGEHLVTLAGAVGEAQYFQADGSSPCTVQWGAAADGSSQFRPASLLPAVTTAKLADEQAIEGIATRHYTFDAATLGLPEDTTASGEVWIAKDGGYVMKYILEVTGSDSFFGSGVQGTRRVEYELSEVGAHPEVVYPAGCEPVLSDMPAMDDASDLTRLPGLVDYNTSATVDEIFAFYRDKLTSMGWQESQGEGQGADSAFTIFIRSDTGAVAFLTVELQADSRWVTVMVLNSGSAAAVPETTPGANATAVAGNPTVRVSLSLTTLLGMAPSQPAPPSFHLEAVDQVPVAAGGSIAQGRDVMSADVQGKDVHFTHRKTRPDGSTKTTEVYIIGGQEYDVVDGQVQPPGDGLASIDWTMWPLDLELMLATASTGATAAGTEVLDGRTAEIYELDATGASLSAATGVELPVTAVSGRVWVDQLTGALLKAKLDYQTDVRDSHGSLLGSGSGHLEITVTQVGQVTVTLPGQ